MIDTVGAVPGLALRQYRGEEDLPGLDALRVRTDLYRSLGFVPARTFTAWRKPL